MARMSLDTLRLVPKDASTWTARPVSPDEPQAQVIDPIIAFEKVEPDKDNPAWLRFKTGTDGPVIDIAPVPLVAEAVTVFQGKGLFEHNFVIQLSEGATQNPQVPTSITLIEGPDRAHTNHVVVAGTKNNAAVVHNWSSRIDVTSVGLPQTGGKRIKTKA